MGEEIVTAYVAGGCRVRVSRWVYAAVSLAQMLTLAGAIFGWPSMSLMLVDAGLFAEGCPADVAPGVACASQATTISLLFTVASVCVFVAPLPTGIFADYAGPRRALILMTSLSALGFALLVVSLRAGVPRLLFAAFGALGASTAMNLPLYSVANAFPGHEGMVMSLLNGAFDASSIVFVVFAAVVSATGVDLGTVALGFLVGPLAALLVTSFLLWRDEHFDVHPSSLPSLAPLQPPGQEGGEAAAATGGAGDVASASAEEGLVVLPLPAGPSEPSPGTTSPRLSPGGRRLRAATAAFAVGSSRTIAGLGRSGSSGASLARIASQSSLPRAVCSPALSPVLEGGGERADSRGMPGELELDGGRASSAASPEDTLAAAAPAPLGEDVVAAPSSIAVAVVEAAPAAAAPEGGEEASVPGAGSIANAGAEAASPDSRAAGSSLEPDIGTAAVIFTPLPFPAAPADSSGGESQNERRASASIYSAIDGVDYDRLQALSFHAQVRTPEFLAYIGFHVVAMLHMYFFLGSASAQLDALSGGSGGPMTRVLGITLPLGFFCQFIVGHVIDAHGLFAALASLWATGVLLAALQLIPVLAIQPLVFVVFVFYRAFIFSCLSNYMARHFGFHTLGETMGTALLLGGLGGLLQTPLLQWGLSAGGLGDFRPPNALLLGLCVAAGGLPLWFGLRTRRLEILCQCARLRRAISGGCARG